MTGGWRKVLVIIPIAILFAVYRGAGVGDVSCGQTITSNTTLTADLTCPVTTSPAINIVGSNITLDLGGYVLKGATPASTATGIMISGAEGVMITNGTIENFGTAITVFNSNNVSLKHLSLRSEEIDCHMTGVQVSRSLDVVIEASQFEMCGGNAVMQYGSGTTIRMNRFIGGNVGLNFFPVCDNTSLPNHSVIMGNSFTDVPTAIWITCTNTTRVEHNTMSGTHGAVHAEGPFQGAITGLTVDYNAISKYGMPIELSGVIEATVSNNDIRESIWGIAVRESWGCIEPSSNWDCFYSTDNLISQNQAVGNGLDLYHHPQAIGNIWQNNVCETKDGVEIPPCGDADGDGVTDSVDNCVFTYNPAQQDTDGNGIGDACKTDSPVDLSGTIKTADETDICAMVLASGQYTFSCNPVGLFLLSGLPRKTDGTVKRQIYAHGFLPKIDILPGSTTEAVVMAHSGVCPNYNIPYDPGFYPASAGKWIDIAGKVFLQYTDTPICAMVLANGQHMFSCDGSGNYALNIPLNSNGQFKLQVYADGFAPTIQTFDEFQAINDVRMARAAECQ